MSKVQPAFLVVVIAAAVLCPLAVLAPFGCSTTAAGLAKEQAIYATATNIVARAQEVAAVIPPPAQNITGAVLALVSIGLAAWNSWQHRQIQDLQSGTAATAAAQVARDTAAQLAATIANLPATISAPTRTQPTQALTNNNTTKHPSQI